MEEDDKYCKYCGIKVKIIPESTLYVGKGKNPPIAYIHTTLRTNSGEASCGRRELTEEDVEYLTEADD